MEVVREFAMETGYFEIGDCIDVRLPEKTYTATAIQDEGDGMLFLFNQYLDEARPMNEGGGTDGGYDASDMRRFLQGLSGQFPEELRKIMMPFENGDFLRLLTMPEMCGMDEHFNECWGQIEWMKQDRRHRIASRREEEYEWGWLATVVSDERFAAVTHGGGASTHIAFSYHGVRPAFKIMAHDAWTS